MTIDMFVDPAVDTRPEPSTEAGELDTLLGFLRWHRATLELKCAGLTPAQLAQRAVPPSSMSLLGMIRHLADVERAWFRRVMSNQPDTPRVFDTAEHPDGGFDLVAADPEQVEQAWQVWRAEVAFADRFIADAPSLDVVGNHPKYGRFSLRWVLVHLVEEYARHMGHVDLLRERIDGKVGQ